MAIFRAPMHGDWERPVGIPQLTKGRVQVWRIDLSEGYVDETKYLSVLSPDEIDRAARLRVGQVRTQFLSGRSCVRTLLGAHLGISPVGVPIAATEYGKPELAPPYNGRVHFNVAHSRSTILIALSLTGPVGIDVEYLDRKTEVEEVAHHSLTEQETSTILAIDDTSAKAKFFFECWTRKEAVVKADGRGLSLPLTSFEVPAESSFGASSVTIRNMDQLSQRTYFVSDLSITEGIACAVATADQPSSVLLLRFPPTNFAP